MREAVPEGGAARAVVEPSTPRVSSALAETSARSGTSSKGRSPAKRRHCSAAFTKQVVFSAPKQPHQWLLLEVSTMATNMDSARCCGSQSSSAALQHLV